MGARKLLGSAPQRAAQVNPPTVPSAQKTLGPPPHPRQALTLPLFSFDMASIMTLEGRNPIPLSVFKVRVDLSVGTTFLSCASLKVVYRVLLLPIVSMAVSPRVVKPVRTGLTLGQLSLVEMEQGLRTRLLLLRTIRAPELRTTFSWFNRTAVVDNFALIFPFLVLVKTTPICLLLRQRQTALVVPSFFFI